MNHWHSMSRPPFKVSYSNCMKRCQCVSPISTFKIFLLFTEAGIDWDVKYWRHRIVSFLCSDPGCMFRRTNVLSAHASYSLTGARLTSGLIDTCHVAWTRQYPPATLPSSPLCPRAVSFWLGVGGTVPNIEICKKPCISQAASSEGTVQIVCFDIFQAKNSFFVLIYFLGATTHWQGANVSLFCRQSRPWKWSIYQRKHDHSWQLVAGGPGLGFASLFSLQHWPLWTLLTAKTWWWIAVTTSRGGPCLLSSWVGETETPFRSHRKCPKTIYFGVFAIFTTCKRQGQQI